jgi:hypothetical protein
MPSTYTPNKDLEMPASGSYASAWAAPLNAVIDHIDSCLGGLATISVTGASGNVVLSTAQYQPPNIEFTGTLTAGVVYYVPTGVGGLWSVFNNATGAFGITLAYQGGGGYVSLTAGQRAFLVCDTVNGVAYADTQYAQAAANAAQSNAETYADASAAAAAAAAQSAAIAAAEAYSSNGSNITSGTVANARLKNVGIGPGVTIAANPGTTPTGAAGSVWFYY